MVSLQSKRWSYLDKQFLRFIQAFCSFFFIHCPTMHHPYQRAITELWINISIHDYSPFLLVHIGCNSCKCIKVLIVFFKMLHVWLLNVGWAPIITPKSFCSKLISILTPLVSILRLSEVTVVEGLFFLTNRKVVFFWASFYYVIFKPCKHIPRTFFQ